MKKFLMILACLILVSTIAIGEAVDFSSMTDEELQIMHASIIAEMASRDIDQAVYVPIGYYKIGQDIPAGSYVISSSAENVYPIIGIAGSVADLQNLNYDETHFIGYGFADGTFLSLVEGTYIEVLDPVLFLKYSLGF